MEKRRVFPIDKSYLTFNLKCFIAMGVWNPYKEGHKYWIYRFYGFYFIVVLIIMRLITTLLRTIYADNMVDLLREFVIFIVQPCDAVKSINVLFNRDEITRLLDSFNWERRLWCSSEISHYRNKVVNDAMKTSKFFTITFMVSLVQIFTFYFYTLLCGTDYAMSDLPISDAPMRYCFLLVNFWQALICDFVAYTIIGINAVCQDSFILSLMINISTQLKILNFRLERCDKTRITSSDTVIDDDPHIRHFECYERKVEHGYVVLDPNEEFISCIKYHQKILSMINLFNEIYGKVLIPQLLSSLLVITVSGLHIILIKADNISDTLVPGGCLLASLMELFVFCWGGNIILVESEKTSDSIHLSNWYNTDKVFQNNLNIFLGVVKKPFVVTAGGMCQLSNVTFQNILGKAYSGMAVLQKTSA